MSAISLDEARAILAERNLIAVGARGDHERRRRHGGRTTFVRVFEVHTDAVPSGLPASASAGEIRVTGTPPSVAAAVASIKAARALAGSTPLSAYSLADLLDLAGSTAGLTDLVARLVAA
ncbi:MAG TPA: hypothetical protein VF921_21105, partial [Vicinamibacterales bacterium]